MLRFTARGFNRTIRGLCNKTPAGIPQEVFSLTDEDRRKKNQWAHMIDDIDDLPNAHINRLKEIILNTADLPQSQDQDTESTPKKTKP